MSKLEKLVWVWLLPVGLLAFGWLVWIYLSLGGAK